MDNHDHLKQERWEDFCDRHGDWGRDLALYVARREGGMRLGERGRKLGGMDYGGVAIAVHRLGKKLEEDPSLSSAHEKVRRLIDKK